MISFAIPNAFHAVQVPVANSNKPMETDPHGTNPHAPGAKLDNDKAIAAVLLDFSRALEKVAEVGTYGAKKYIRLGWSSVPDGQLRYRDAMVRHLLKSGHEELDQEMGVDHLAAVIWNACAVLELKLRESGK